MHARFQIDARQSLPARLLAFYLPQYHAIPENDVWWGEGFTEWTNVRKARAKFPGHQQPLIPTELGYYDLAASDVMERQIRLAQAHGIHGFCFYHYWFNGRLILEKPVHSFFNSGIAYPYCLCWANENWSKNWDGGNREILLEQNHSLEDDVRHFSYFLPFLRDPRYITVKGKPLLTIYRASLLPDVAATLTLWRRLAVKNGLSGLHICKVESLNAERAAPGSQGFDAAIEFQPDWANLGPHHQEALFGKHRVFDYETFSLRQMAKPPVPYLRYPCVTPRWDNTARRQDDSVILAGISPELYRRWLSVAIEQAQALPEEQRLVFINAWNEWGEGCTLEPDLLYGRRFLEQTRLALDARIRQLDWELHKELQRRRI